MPSGAKSVPAISKAPLDYLFALAISAGAIIGSFFVKPAETEWVVFGVGVVMTLSVLLAAAKPTKA